MQRKLSIVPILAVKPEVNTRASRLLLRFIAGMEDFSPYQQALEATQHTPAYVGR